MTVKDENRCTYRYVDSAKNRDLGRVGKQCGKAAEDNGTGRCKFHGGRAPAMVQTARRRAIEREMEADPGFNGIWPEDHELLDPFSLLLWEIRRSGHRIAYLDRQMSQLEEERDLWWGQTKREEIGASEFAGVNETFEAREHVYLKRQDIERKRMFDLMKEWQSNKFEATRIMALGEFGQFARLLTTRLVEELGHDLQDQHTQDAIARVLGAMPALKIEQGIAAT